MVSESPPGGASSREPGPDEVYCRDCGSIIKERAEICPECGVRQRSALFSNVDESGIAAVASLLIPGAGQIFLGHLERGLLFIAATFVAAFMSMFVVGIPLLIAVWLYAIYDAYKLGEDPTRAGRVWGANTDATPVADIGTAHEERHSGSTASDTDATGDRNLPADADVAGEGGEDADTAVGGDTDASGEDTDAETRQG